MEFTCKGCQTRHPTCHSECEKYIAEKKAHEERMEAQRKQTVIAQGLYIEKDSNVQKALRRAKHAKRYFT